MAVLTVTRAAGEPAYRRAPAVGPSRPDMGLSASFYAVAFARYPACPRPAASASEPSS